MSFAGDLGGERSASLSTGTVNESVVRGQGLEMFGMGAGSIYASGVWPWFRNWLLVMVLKEYLIISLRRCACGLVVQVSVTGPCGF